MSGSLAARYIAGLPYDPSLGVGQYARGPRAPAPTGTGEVPGGAFTLPQTDAGGNAVRVPTAATTVPGPTLAPVSPISPTTPTASPGGGGDSGNMLLAAALGALPLLGYVPDAIDWIDRQFSEAPPAQGTAADWRAFDNGSFTGPGGVQIPNAALGGFGANWDRVFEPGWTIDDTATQALLDAPMPAGDQFAGRAGDVAAANGAGPTASGVFGGEPSFFNPLGVPPDTMQAGSDALLGTYGGIPIEALGTSAAASALFGRGTQAFAKPGGELGASVGSTLGGVLGMFTGPLAPIASPLLTIAGGAIGGQIGPAPTIGRNFSSIGTFTGDGNLAWGNSGGDNGASAADADPFASWFGDDLFQRAAAQGLQFNPNMAGAQIRVGGYDNFDRGGPTPGGYFYTPDAVGGSPENYALRPSSDFWNDAYSPGQASAFTTNVLADLASRGVFTAPGATQPGMDFWQSTQGTPLGWYGAAGGDYSTTQYGGGGGFNDILTGRQNAVQGYQNAQQQAAQEMAARNNTASMWTPDTGQTWGAYDLSQPVWANGGMVNPGDSLFPTMATPQGAPAEVWGGGYQGNG